jgi:multidrug efflux system membrane fusion protein
VRVPGSEEYEGLLIPDEALGTDQSQKFVYVSNSQNIVEYRAVKTGPRVHGLRVITEGLHPSDWIVVNGVQRVRPNAQIDPQKETISFSKKSKTNRVGTRITALARK